LRTKGGGGGWQNASALVRVLSADADEALLNSCGLCNAALSFCDRGCEGQLGGGGPAFALATPDEIFGALKDEERYRWRTKWQGKLGLEGDGDSGARGMALAARWSSADPTTGFPSGRE